MCRRQPVGRDPVESGSVESGAVEPGEIDPKLRWARAFPATALSVTGSITALRRPVVRPCNFLPTFSVHSMQLQSSLLQTVHLASLLRASSLGNFGDSQPVMPLNHDYLAPGQHSAVQ